MADLLDSISTERRDLLDSIADNPYDPSEPPLYPLPKKFSLTQPTKIEEKIFGLFKKYVWARLFAIYFNVIVVFFWGILKLIPIFMGVDFFYVYTISEVFLDCFIVLFAVSLIVFYSLKATRNLFNK